MKMVAAMGLTKKKIGAFLGGFFYMALGLSPVWADDTEIYFGNVGNSGGTANVLFILDTSGSMDTRDGKKSTSRLDDLKSVFKSLIETTNNVNVGIMRFSDPGGPILYPVANLNQALVDGSAAPVVTSTIASVGDDGYQLKTSGKVVLNSTGLELGAEAPYAGVTISTTSAAVSSATDDAVTRTDNNSTTIKGSQSDEAKYLYSPTNQNNGSAQRVVGLRFSKVDVPIGAVITRAYLQVEVGPTTSSPDNSDFQLALYGEKSDGGTFTSSNTPGARVKKTANLVPGATTPVLWTISSANLPATDDVIRSPDISAIIQPIVQQSGWDSGKPITLLYNKAATSASNSWISFSAYDRYSSVDKAVPKLVVEYYVPPPSPSPAAVLTALRFNNVGVPKGATIKRARITFTALASDSSPASLSIYTEKTGSSAALTDANNNLTARAKNTVPVHWDNIDPWVAGNSYDTPELKSIVQEIVNYDGTTGTNSTPGWCGGSAMTFLIDGAAGRRLAAAYDDASNPPVLTIEYDPSTITNGATCNNASFATQILAGSDDAEQYGKTTVLNNSSLKLVAYTRNSTRYAQTVGLRFSNIKVPQGSVITGAHLEFVAAGTNTTTVNSGFTIKGQASDNAETFRDSDNNISGRATTSASVRWNATSNPVLSDWSNGNTYSSPDLTSIVQELVNRSGWASGNSMAMIITGTDTSNLRQATAYEGGAGKVAKLIINFRDTTALVKTVRDTLLSTTDSLTAKGNTPIQDTMYEAALYFLGENVLYGAKRGGGPYAYTRVSHADSMVPGTFTINRPSGCTDSNPTANACAGETITPVAARGAAGGARYKSPVSASCQVNHVVLLTDGEANRGRNSTDLIKSLTSSSSCDRNNTDMACVKNLAAWMYDNNVPVPGTKQKTAVITDTIAFYLSNTTARTFLDEVAEAGGGTSYSVTDAEELKKVFKTILVNVQQTNTSFVSAGTAVNAFNRTLNRDELYFSVFQPQTNPRWPGNVKKYKLAPPPSTAILDAANANAVDSNGFFSSSAKSFWSSVPDGATVTLGGAGGMITDYSARKLYTYLDNLDTPDKNLTAAANALKSTNSDLTQDVMGVSGYTAQNLADLIDWVRGKDVQNSANADGTRYVFADPLHSRPVAVTYGGTEDNPDITVFVSTNSGFLHAINNDTGAEQFAFIPRDLLPIQQILYNNTMSSPHPYGLDGSITVWVMDPDDDGLVLDKDGHVQADNAVYLYAGMRRGGRNYYALDVTDRSAPKMLWTIKGGTDTGFNNLGETWSQPLKARVNVSGTVHNALIFSGGYDENQDTSKQRDTKATDSMGNAVYIVDAVSGALLWSGSNATGATKVFSDMKYSIPSSITGADINGDGLMDILFVGDTGGQLWRFDIHNGSEAGELVTGGVIADLNAAGDTATPANNRRFYHSPAMFIGVNGSKPYLGITLGSGWRAHPLNTETEDRFFMIRQYDIFSAPSTYKKLTAADLYNATDNILGEGSEDEKATAQTQLSTAEGWYLEMNNDGEKVLSTPLVVEGQLFFDTYQPGSISAADPCQPATGINRSYTISAFDATPVNEYNGVTGLQAADRSQIISAVGIIDQQRQLIRKGPDGQLISVGLEGTATKNLPSDFFKKVHRIYWYENR